MTNYNVLHNPKVKLMQKLIHVYAFVKHLGLPSGDKFYKGEKILISCILI